jgi:type VI secretion system protein ImpE
MPVSPFFYRDCDKKIFWLFHMDSLKDLRQVKLEDALREVQAKVRDKPASVEQRVLLFQLLCVLGEWDRAVGQLGVLGELDAATLPMVHTYRAAIACEKVRREVFDGKRTPLVLGSPERWVALLTEALRHAANGEFTHANALRDEAFDLAPATSGIIDGDAFEWIADADPRLGPVTEAVINGAYYWVPFHRVRTLNIEQPSDLRDLVWVPAHFTWSNGGEAFALLPARYPDSENQDEGDIRLARKTVWQEPSAGIYFGLGQRMLATDTGEYSLLDVRAVSLDSQGSEDSAPSPPPPEAAPR